MRRRVGSARAWNTSSCTDVYMHRGAFFGKAYVAELAQSVASRWLSYPQRSMRSPSWP